MLPKLLDTVADRTVVVGYSKLGYLLRDKLLHKQQWRPLPERALLGKRVLITGASSGLGKATATGLASLGATVHLVVRDPHKGERTRREILEQIAAEQIPAAQMPEPEIHVDHCDVSSLASVRQFAEKFLTEKFVATGQNSGKERVIDALIHNAGVLSPQRQETP